MAATAEKSSTELLQEKLLSLQIAREELELQQRRRTEVEYTRQQDEVAAAKLVGRSALIQQRKNELALQESCNHTKPNGHSSLGGQYDHRGDFHFICAYCSKEWTNSEVPLHLRIDQQLIGGPSLT